MKILQVTQRFLPAIGGIEYHVYEISKRMSMLGHEVTVLTSNWLNDKDIRGFSTSRPFSLRHTPPKLPVQEVMCGVLIKRYTPIFQFITYTFNPGLILCLIKNIKKYDIVHVHHYMVAEAFIVALTCKIRGARFILTAHVVESSQKSIYGFIKKAYDKTIGKFILKNAFYCVALTPINKEDHVNLSVPMENIRVIPNGVDFEKFGCPVNNDISNIKNIDSDKLVLFVGRLEEYKGAQYIIEAAPIICAEFPNTKFIFIGEDFGFKSYLIEIAKCLNVNDKCIFTGKVDDSLLVTYYKMANVFVLPSINEGFGLVALESIVCGTPVILANEKGLKYILSEIGGYPLDMKKNIAYQIANYAINIFRNPNDDLVEQQKLRIKCKFTWESVVQNLLKTYSRVNEK